MENDFTSRNTTNTTANEETEPDCSEHQRGSSPLTDGIAVNCHLVEGLPMYQ